MLYRLAEVLPAKNDDINKLVLSFLYLFKRLYTLYSFLIVC